MESQLAEDVDYLIVGSAIVVRGVHPELLTSRSRQISIEPRWLPRHHPSLSTSTNNQWLPHQWPGDPLLLVPVQRRCRREGYVGSNHDNRVQKATFFIRACLRATDRALFEPNHFYFTLACGPPQVITVEPRHRRLIANGTPPNPRSQPRRDR